MKLIFRTWYASRIMRLGLGIALGVYAWHEANGMIGVLAAWLCTQAIFNIGCCGSQVCNVSSKNSSKNDSHEINYEEISANKKP